MRKIFHVAIITRHRRFPEPNHAEALVNGGAGEPAYVLALDDRQVVISRKGDGSLLMQAVARSGDKANKKARSAVPDLAPGILWSG